MKLLIAVMLSIVFVATASAADATGTWSGKLNVTGPDGQQQEDTRDPQPQPHAPSRSPHNAPHR